MKIDHNMNIFQQKKLIREQISALDSAWQVTKEKLWDQIQQEEINGKQKIQDIIKKQKEFDLLNVNKKSKINYAYISIEMEEVSALGQVYENIKNGMDLDKAAIVINMIKVQMNKDRIKWLTYEIDITTKHNELMRACDKKLTRVHSKNNAIRSHLIKELTQRFNHYSIEHRRLANIICEINDWVNPSRSV